MKNTTTLANILLLSLVMLLGGCTGKQPPPDQHSGFLEDYSSLQTETDSHGNKVLRYVSSRIKTGGYKKVMLEPVQYFPKPQATEKVPPEALKEIKAYINETLKREIGKRVEVVQEPAPDVIRIRVALTAVDANMENLQPYQYIPVALVLTGARMAAGGHPDQASVFLEAEMSDSITGERLAIAIRGGKGERLEKLQGAASEVTLESVKPLLDTWADAYIKFIFNEMQ